MRRTSICGAAETLLIDQNALKTHAKDIINSLIKSGCKVLIWISFNNKLTKAKEKDWKTEYLDAIISVKTVKDVNEAVSHILKYGTMHTDSVIINNLK